MTIRMFFTILAVLSFLFGIGFVLAPDQVLANYGIEHSPALALLGRLFGGALLTDTLARQGLPRRGRRARGADRRLGRGRRKSRCSDHGNLGRHDECVGVVHCADLSLRGRWERIFPNGANIAAIAPVSWFSNLSASFFPPPPVNLGTLCADIYYAG